MDKRKPSTGQWHLDPDTGELIDPDDAPELTEEWFAGADVYEGGKLIARGRPPLPPAERKQRVTLRLSPAVLDYFRAMGSGWQTRIDETLRRVVAENIHAWLADEPVRAPAAKRAPRSKGAGSARGGVKAKPPGPSTSLKTPGIAKRKQSSRQRSTTGTPVKRKRA